MHENVAPAFALPLLGKKLKTIYVSHFCAAFESVLLLESAFCAQKLHFVRFAAHSQSTNTLVAHAKRTMLIRKGVGVSSSSSVPSWHVVARLWGAKERGEPA